MLIDILSQQNRQRFSTENSLLIQVEQILVQLPTDMDMLVNIKST